MVRRPLLVSLLSPLAALLLLEAAIGSGAPSASAENPVEAALFCGTDPEAAPPVSAAVQAAIAFPRVGVGDAFVRGGSDGEDDFACGECPASQSNDENRWHAAFAALSPVAKAVPGPRGRAALEKRGPGPVLAFLSDTLILSRPPPGRPGTTPWNPGIQSCEPTDTDRRTIP